jgi:hypothetical protein
LLGRILRVGQDSTTQLYGNLTYASMASVMLLGERRYLPSSKSVRIDIEHQKQVEDEKIFVTEKELP